MVFFKALFLKFDFKKKSADDNFSAFNLEWKIYALAVI